VGASIYMRPCSICQFELGIAIVGFMEFVIRSNATEKRGIPRIMYEVELGRPRDVDG
jgi:hypothetical protein